MSRRRGVSDGSRETWSKPSSLASRSTAIRSCASVGLDAAGLAQQPDHDRDGRVHAHHPRRAAADQRWVAARGPDRDRRPIRAGRAANSPPGAVPAGTVAPAQRPRSPHAAAGGAAARKGPGREGGGAGGFGHSRLERRREPSPSRTAGRPRRAGKVRRPGSSRQGQAEKAQAEEADNPPAARRRPGDRRRRTGRRPKAGEKSQADNSGRQGSGRQISGGQVAG